MKAYIGRQPLFDDHKRVMGFDLLYRNRDNKSAANVVDGESATRSVLSDAVGLFGMDHLTDGLPAYVKFTRNLILKDLALMVGPEQIVVQIMSDVKVDDLLLEKLQMLKEKGYRLSLQGYRGQVRFKRLSGLFDVVRIDCIENNSIRRRELYDSMYRPDVLLVADRIERESEFENCKHIGFNLFQGYYFERPSWLSKPRPQWNATSYGRILGELLKPSPSLRACYNIIRTDMVLSYMLLREVQTVRYYRGNVVTNLQQAIVIMGLEELRRWVCLVMMKQSVVTTSEEEARKAYTRAQFIERLMINSNTHLDPKKGFLLGMFSQLDKVMGVSLQSLLSDLEMDPEMRNALLGYEDNEYTHYLQFALVYELKLPTLILPDIHTQMSEGQVQRLYDACVTETETVFSSMEGQ